MTTLTKVSRENTTTSLLKPQSDHEKDVAKLHFAIEKQSGFSFCFFLVLALNYVLISVNDILNKNCCLIRLTNLTSTKCQSFILFPEKKKSGSYFSKFRQLFRFFSGNFLIFRENSEIFQETFRDFPADIIRVQSVFFSLKKIKKY